MSRSRRRSRSSPARTPRGRPSPPSRASVPTPRRRSERSAKRGVPRSSRSSMPRWPRASGGSRRGSVLRPELGMESRLAAPLESAMESLRRFWAFAGPGTTYARLKDSPAAANLVFGDPHEMPLPGIAEALRRAAVPERPDWFSYATSRPEAEAFLATRLAAETGLPFAPEDVILTSGAFAGLAAAVRALCGPGDEAVLPRPAWFAYEPILLAAGAVPRRVHVVPGCFDLDLAALAASLGERTRALLLNSPHNPTGGGYGAATLAAGAPPPARAAPGARAPGHPVS